MRRTSFSLGAFALMLATAPVSLRAQDAAAAPVAPFKLQLDLGLVNAAGNTRLTSFNLGDNLEFKTGSIKVVQFAAVTYGRSADSTTAEQYKVGGRLDKQLFFVVHGFVGGTYERNTFAGIGHRTSEYAGLAIVLMDLPTDLLDFDFGSALSQQGSSLGAADRNYTSLRFGTRYRHNFSKAAYLSQTLEYLPNLTVSTAWQGTTETILVAPVSEGFALRMSYLVKYDNFPEPGFEKSDRLLSSGVQITF